MQIINPVYKWTSGLVSRGKTDAIVLHHAAMNGTATAIHNIHVNQNGWSGIGYHFYIRKDGSVYSGRPIDKMGAHASGHNNHTIGVCFEGNFEKEVMSVAQLKAGKEIISYIKNIYGNDLKVLKHSDVCATACPGRNFPFEEMITPISVSEDVVVNQMFIDGVISKENISNWEAFLGGKATPRPEYIRTIIQRYQDKV